MTCGLEALVAAKVKGKSCLLIRRRVDDLGDLGEGSLRLLIISPFAPRIPETVNWEEALTARKG